MLHIDYLKPRKCDYQIVNYDDRLYSIKENDTVVAMICENDDSHTTTCYVDYKTSVILQCVTNAYDMKSWSGHSFAECLELSLNHPDNIITDINVCGRLFPTVRLNGPSYFADITFGTEYQNSSITLRDDPLLLGIAEYIKIKAIEKLSDPNNRPFLYDAVTEALDEYYDMLLQKKEDEEHE